jgi:nucleoside 2-deoxyribosyltransferase
MTQYSIVVGVPEPRDTIFIARPFSPDFDAILSAILLAIAGVPDFSPSVTDLNPENVSFKTDIVNKIREARVLVAVCSQESTTKKSNPNVMYELGFARSIGKPTVVLMNRDTQLPADLQGDQVLIYEQGQETAMVPKLTTRLTVLLGKSSNTKHSVLNYAA